MSQPTTDTVTTAPGRVPIRALLMDADGVLQQPVPGWTDEMSELGGGPDFVEELFQRELAALDGSIDLAEVVVELLESRGLPLRWEQVIQTWQAVDLYRPMLQLVTDVRRAGVITALATNQHSYRGEWMRRTLPYRDYFDHSFYSYELGTAKPDPAYFEHVIEVLGVAPEAAVFVDDRLDNVEAARELGLHGIHCSPVGDADLVRTELRRLGVPGA
ncbi:MAG: HAD family phosphatase [Micropruina sp.]|uniref:HAD family hydrolase n=1 Tax=Micropruina sp. TaxID=2737536 RepID=UPI0039E477BC